MEEDPFSIPVDLETTSALHHPVSCSGAPRATLVLAHGAGTGMRHGTLDAIARELVARGIEVVRFNFLYRERGGRGPDPMPVLEKCYRAAAAATRERLRPARLLLGGHSMGGRVGSRIAADGEPCDGLVLCGYPLHPVGKPTELRSAHLAAIPVPVLCMNGTRDSLCRRDLMEGTLAALPPESRWTMRWLADADHGYDVPKRTGRTRDDVIREMAATVDEWLGE